MDAKSRVVIIGAGFGGLRAAQNLAHAPVQVTLIDRRNYHLFQPLLYQVATAGISPHEIAYPVRAIFRKQKNLDFLLAEVKGIDFAARLVRTDQGDVPYDYLIVATGAASNFYGHASLAQNALTLKDVGDAVQVRNHLLKMFELAAHEPDIERRRALLTFTVAGGGPTGVESAGAFSELIRLVLRRDHPHLNLDDVHIILLEGAETLLTGFPPRLQRNALKVLAAKHVEVRTGAAVEGFDGERVLLKDGSAIPTKTLLWSAGVRAAPLADGLGVEQVRQGRLRVTPELQIPDHSEVYVIGDSAYAEDGDGRPLPMMAPVATQQAARAVANILAQIGGRSPHPFAYRDPGSLATIGRNAAVARIGRWEFTGFAAWVTWLVVHLVGLIGFRNKLIVLIDWAWDYFFYDRAVRLITGE
jgi:NADH dehydrogenase